MIDVNLSGRVFNAVSGRHDPIRAVTTIKTGYASAYGNTVIWTPAAGKRIRVMGYCLQTTAARLGSAGDIAVTVLESGGAFLGQFLYGLTTTSTPQPAPVISFAPSGYLLSAADKAVSLDLSGGLASGRFQLTIWGNEE